MVFKRGLATKRQFKECFRVYSKYLSDIIKKNQRINAKKQLLLALSGYVRRGGKYVPDVKNVRSSGAILRYANRHGYSSMPERDTLLKELRKELPEQARSFDTLYHNNKDLLDIHRESGYKNQAVQDAFASAASSFLKLSKTVKAEHDVLADINKFSEIFNTELEEYAYMNKVTVASESRLRSLIKRILSYKPSGSIDTNSTLFKTVVIGPFVILAYMMVVLYQQLIAGFPSDMDASSIEAMRWVQAILTTFGIVAPFALFIDHLNEKAKALKRAYHRLRIR